MRSTARKGSGGSGTWARSEAVREKHRLGEAGWMEKYEHRLRWKAEIVFSAVKRVLGEALRSRRSDLMLREAQHKFARYNELVSV